MFCNTPTSFVICSHWHDTKDNRTVQELRFEWGGVSEYTATRLWVTKNIILLLGLWGCSRKLTVHVLSEVSLLSNLKYCLHLVYNLYILIFRSCHSSAKTSRLAYKLKALIQPSHSVAVKESWAAGDDTSLSSRIDVRYCFDLGLYSYLWNLASLVWF